MLNRQKPVSITLVVTRELYEARSTVALPEYIAKECIILYSLRLVYIIIKSNTMGSQVIKNTLPHLKENAIAQVWLVEQKYLELYYVCMMSWD